MKPQINSHFGIAIFLALVIEKSAASYKDTWLSFPACRMGRLQSPIKLNITNSVYNSTYAIVYQNYRSFPTNPKIQKKETIETIEKIYPFPQTNNLITGGGGFINFQKGGVIKQYELLRFELYQGSHQVGLEISDYELHIVHKKVLGFTSNQNRYRTIQDANNYLVIVLRYLKKGGKILDNGLLKSLIDTSDPKFDLSTYPVFQDKSSYYYEGAFMYNPCDEDVNYIVIESPYVLEEITGLEELYPNQAEYGKKDLVYSYERPIYRNFMNYTESLDSYLLFYNPIMIVVLLLMQL